MYKHNFYKKIYLFFLLVFLIVSLTGCFEEESSENFIGEYSVEVKQIGEGEIIISPDKEYYAKNDKVKIGAIPNSNYLFYAWDEVWVGLNNPLELTVNDNLNILAYFTEKDNSPKIRDIYGDEEPTIVVREILSKNYGITSTRGFSFNYFFERNDKGILIHIIGDGLSDKLSNKLYGMSLRKLDNITEENGLYFNLTFVDKRPVLLISAKNTKIVKEEYSNNPLFREAFDRIVQTKYVKHVNVNPTENIVWESTGHTPKVFKGLFTNPDYSNLSSFLEEDEVVNITPQVEKVAELINDEKNISTLKEIYNLLRTIPTDERPSKIFEVSASKILSTPIIGGCTTYATAFAALAKAKGIPTVIVDCAKLEWIEDGCSLGYVQGHFFVEVFIEGEWFLVDSTSGELYLDYDRGNWFLPNEYIAFYKALSVIDTGATEKTHNLLQRVAFVKRQDINYIDPNYRKINLYDEALRNEMEDKYNNLELEEDNFYQLDTSGSVFKIKASSEQIDFQNIPY